MPSRYRRKKSAIFPTMHIRLFAALKDRLAEGYSLLDFRADLMSGLVVALIAIPLGMALAIASGVAPQYGLYTVVIGGSLIALFGGSRFQVSGPTAAFVVILFPIVQKFGFGGLLVAGLMAGIILIMMGISHLGRLIQFIPYPVTTGFTSGIAVVIATMQIKDLFGLQISNMPEDYLSKINVIFHAFGTLSFAESAVGIATLGILIFWPRINKQIPSPLIALSFASLAVIFIKTVFPDFFVATIGSRFVFNLNGTTGHGVPQVFPAFSWPWSFVGANGLVFNFTLENIKSLVPSAFAIAMLGAIESLLSAVVADGMARTKHNPDTELVALGIGNIICPFFGGIPATGAIARTATNIRFGARSPISAIIHSLAALLVILLFAPYVSYLPMAALSGLLILVAYNMSEVKHFIHILKVAPKSDVIVLLICFFLTVMFDMVVGVTVGVGLAALLFMRRMAEVTEGHKVNVKEHPLISLDDIPADVVVYEIEGPLFFGAAEKAAKTLIDITDNIRGIIFLMAKVSVMDVTGLVALDGAIKKLCLDNRKVCLVGLRTQPLDLIKRAGLAHDKKDIFVAENISDAIAFIMKDAP